MSLKKDVYGRTWKDRTMEWIGIIFAFLFIIFATVSGIVEMAGRFKFFWNYLFN